MHRARAARFPLRALGQLLRLFADRPDHQGEAPATSTRACIRSTCGPTSHAAYHANLQLDIDGGGLRLAALDAPLENIRGRLQLVDDVVFLRHMHASLAGIPLHLAGGISDLAGDLDGPSRSCASASTEPATSRACAERLRLRATSRSPGRFGLGVLVEGPLENPPIVAPRDRRARDLSPAAVRLARCPGRLSRQRRIALAAARVLRRYRGRHSRHDDDRKARAIRLSCAHRRLGRPAAVSRRNARTGTDAGRRRGHRHRYELHRQRCGGVGARRRPGRSADRAQPQRDRGHRAVLAAHRARRLRRRLPARPPERHQRVLGPGRQSRHARANVYRLFPVSTFRRSRSSMGGSPALRLPAAVRARTSCSPASSRGIEPTLAA